MRASLLFVLLVLASPLRAEQFDLESIVAEFGPILDALIYDPTIFQALGDTSADIAQCVSANKGALDAMDSAGNCVAESYPQIPVGFFDAIFQAVNLSVSLCDIPDSTLPGSTFSLSLTGGSGNTADLCPEGSLYDFELPTFFVDTPANYTVNTPLAEYEVGIVLAYATDADGAIVSAEVVSALPSGIALNANNGDLYVADVALLVYGYYDITIIVKDALGWNTTVVVPVVIAVEPTEAPTAAPTLTPTAAPTLAPTAVPTVAPTSAPTAAPTSAPTTAPTSAPTTAPSCATAPTVTQAKQTEWSSNGVSYSQWGVTVVTGSQNLFGLKLNLALSSGSIQNIWGATAEGYYYIINDWRLQSKLAVPPYTTLSFGYQVSNTVGAAISVKYANCDAPTDCAVSVTPILQNSWTDNNAHHRQYVLQLTNVGTYPTNTATIKVSNIKAGAYPTNQWNLATIDSQAQVISSAQVTYVAALWGLRPGSTGSSNGFVLSTPIANIAQTGALDTPTFSFTSAVCSV